VAVATLSVGDHTITFQADDGEGGVASAMVAVTVVADITQLPPVPDALAVGPSLLAIDLRTSATLTIENENTLNPLAWEAVASEPWVHLSATAGNAPSEVTVSLDPSGLAPGTYNASITVNSPAGSKIVAVQATVGGCVGDCDNSGDVGISELIR